MVKGRGLMRTMRTRHANSRLHRPLATSAVGGLGPIDMMTMRHVRSGGILGLIGFIGPVPLCAWSKIKEPSNTTNVTT